MITTILTLLTIAGAGLSLDREGRNMRLDRVGLPTLTWDVTLLPAIIVGLSRFFLAGTLEKWESPCSKILENEKI